MGANGFVGGEGCRHRPMQTLQESFNVVVAKFQFRLGFVVVTKVAHAQAGRMGQVQGIVIEAFQLVRLAFDEAGGNGG